MFRFFRRNPAFGCLFLLALPLLLGLIFSVQAKADQSLPRQKGQSSVVYLPSVMTPELLEPEPPTLIAPADEAMLDTLIPTFVWQPAPLIEGVEVGSVLTFDPDPDELDGWWSSGYAGATDIISRVAWFNFEPDTVYYWRVGHIYDWDYDNINWSETRSFRTGAAGGVIPAAPVLYGPDDGSSTPQNNLFLEWNAVQGAVAYSVSIQRPNGSYYGWSDLVDQYLDLRSDGYGGIFTPGGPYKWSVQARNDYAWSEDSEIWTFNISESKTATAGQSFASVVKLRMSDGSVRYAPTR